MKSIFGLLKSKQNFLLGTTGTLLFSGVCYKASKENLPGLSSKMAFADEAGHLVFGWGSSK
jgi:hypothetical protein